MEEIDSSRCKSQKEPVLIRQVPNESKYWNYIKRIGSVLAIILTIYVLFTNLFPDLFSTLKVESKLISLNYKPYHLLNTPIISDTSEEKGIYFFSRISLNVIGSDLNFKDINIFVRFQNNTKKYKCELIGLFDHLNKWILNGNCYYAEIPKNEILFYQSMLEMNKTHLNYLSFYLKDSNNYFLDKDLMFKNEFLIPESFEIEFIFSKKRTFSLKNRSSIKTQHYLNEKIERMILFDDSIYKECD